MVIPVIDHSVTILSSNKLTGYTISLLITQMYACNTLDLSGMSAVSAIAVCIYGTVLIYRLPTQSAVQGRWGTA